MIWVETTLGDICRMYQPDTIPARDMKAESHYPVYGANGIIGRYDKYNHEKPQLLVSCRGACGAVNITKPFSWINGNAMVIQPDTSKVSLQYMEFLFRGGMDLSKAITGSVQLQITRQSLNSITFSYPPLAEQRSIVARLDAVLPKIARAIELAKAKDVELGLLKGALLTKELFHRRYGAVKWKVVKLGDVCQITNGGTPKINEATYWGDEIKWLTPKDMGKLEKTGKLCNRYVSETERQITHLGLEHSSAKLVPENSVLLSCRAPIGYVAINEVPMSFNQGCKGLVPKDLDHKSVLLVDYLYYVLLASRVKLNKLGTGTMFKEISAKVLADVDISLPSLAEQRRIVARLDAAFAASESVRQASDKSKQNYAALQTAILTRELKSGRAHARHG